ncbi:MAG: Hsp70 family protein, partial [Treponema sp.]|nr:Hsp70 family protein [Treponema sp.]
MAGTIGIKIANGDFYPILTGNAAIKKRLVLTTVHDGQESVQIDLYKSNSNSMRDAQCIGSILVENIESRPKGEPSIEMVISRSDDDVITADACVLDASLAGKHHILNVSLKKPDINHQIDSSPNYELGKKPQVPAALYGQDESNAEEKRKFPWLIIACAILFLILAIGLVWFFFLGGRDMPVFARSGQKYEQTAPSPPLPPPPEPAVQLPPPPAP